MAYLLRHRSLTPPQFIGEGARLTAEISEAMRFPFASLALVWLEHQAPDFARLYDVAEIVEPTDDETRHG